MSRSQRFFRVLWRINAVFILIATGTIAVALVVVIIQESRLKPAKVKTENVRRDADSNTVGERLNLEQPKIMADSGVVRMDLVATSESKGVASGGTSRQTRNILFIEPGQNSGHWLLPDNKHEISDSSDVYKRPVSEDSDVLATAAIARPVDDEAGSPGRLLLFSHTGRNVIEVAKDATSIDVVAIMGNDLVLIFHRNAKLLRATFDPETLAKRSEQEIAVPPIK
jgi:hypothetical protein